jgi:GNAT superfamily N-acetyltransferase
MGGKLKRIMKVEPRQTSLGKVPIRPLVPADETQWRELWNGYLRFYGVLLDSSITDNLWRSIVSDHPTIIGFGATLAGKLVGFAHVVPHPVTWAIGDAGYLEDLFVERSARRQRVGSALIEHVVAAAEEQAWARVYWHTRVDNFTARRMYDRFVPSDDVVRYTMRLG